MQFAPTVTVEKSTHFPTVKPLWSRGSVKDIEEWTVAGIPIAAAAISEKYFIKSM